MVQQTIQDLFAITEAGPRAEDILDRVRDRLERVERFDAGEIVVQSENGLFHFVLAPGLGETGRNALAVLGDQATLRFDTAASLQEGGLTSSPGINSVLMLRLAAPSVTSAAILLGHRRAWSFAGTPLTRIHAIASVALRLLTPGSRPGETRGEVTDLRTEVTRLRTHISSLEREIAGLRSDQARRFDGPR